MNTDEKPIKNRLMAWPPRLAFLSFLSVSIRVHLWLKSFPFGEHDDLLDAAATGTAYLLDRAQARVWWQSSHSGT